MIFSPPANIFDFASDLGAAPLCGCGNGTARPCLGDYADHLAAPDSPHEIPCGPMLYAAFGAGKNMIPRKHRNNIAYYFISAWCRLAFRISVYAQNGDFSAVGDTHGDFHPGLHHANSSALYPCLAYSTGILNQCGELLNIN